MWGIPSWALFPSPLWPGVEKYVRVPSIGLIDLLKQIFIFDQTVHKNKNSYETTTQKRKYE